jgi:F0F1-type ATP synthase epsilon subunit
MKTLTVELSIPSGRVFTAESSSIDLRTGDGCVHLNSSAGSFMNLIHATEVMLRTRDGTLVFGLENAVAGLKGSTLSILAERIQRIEPERPATRSSPESPR